jgi:hypothetical protein
MFKSKNLQKLFIFVKENLDLQQQPSINDPQQPKRRRKNEVDSSMSFLPVSSTRTYFEVSIAQGQ